MKKALIIIISFFLFTTSIFAFNKNKILNIFENGIKNLKFEDLEDVSYRLDEIKTKEKYSDKKYQDLFIKMNKHLKNEIGKKVLNPEYSYVLDFDINEEIVGFSDNVFVAQVIKNNGSKKSDAIYDNPIMYDFLPQTSYTVKVLYNIKGNLNGNINLILDGGYNKKGALVISEETSFPQKSGIYLFTTRLEKNYIITHKNGIHLLYYSPYTKKLYKNNVFLENKKLKDIIKNNKKVLEFREAYIKESNYKTKNSYKDLDLESQKKLGDFENGFVGELK